MNLFKNLISKAKGIVKNNIITMSLIFLATLLLIFNIGIEENETINKIIFFIVLLGIQSFFIETNLKTTVKKIITYIVAVAISLSHYLQY